MKRVRLDQLLVMRGLFTSREKARRVIIAGRILVDGRLRDKPGKEVDTTCDLTVLAGQKYVGRGGEKLEAAIEEFGVTVRDKECLDIGASTGGFTDCLLQSGAARVIAVDVGYGQLARALRVDTRVTILERTNARYLQRADLPYEPELVTIDVSFISLKLIFPAVKRIVKKGADIIALIKPQFEARRGEVRRGGVILDELVHTRIKSEIRAFSEAHGFTVKGLIESPLRGPAGNREFFIHLRAG